MRRYLFYNWPLLSLVVWCIIGAPLSSRLSLVWFLVVLVVTFGFGYLMCQYQNACDRRRERDDAIESLLQSTAKSVSKGTV